MENPKRENRNKVANNILENPDLFTYLVEIVFDVDNKTSIKAAWILEWICTHKQLYYIAPHLTFFTKNISKLTFDSAIRPCAKICEHLATAYHATTDNLIKNSLTKQHIDAIVETGFDWLITPQKIAVRAYTMQTLYLFGLEKDWIHPELSHLISTRIIHQSKGCKVRGEKILAWIKEHKQL
jgi:hypothetical protein